MIGKQEHSGVNSILTSYNQCVRITHLLLTLTRACVGEGYCTWSVCVSVYVTPELFIVLTPTCQKCP